MKTIGLLVVIGLSSCAPRPKCHDIVREDGVTIEVCEKRICRDVSRGVFVECPEVRP